MSANPKRGVLTPPKWQDPANQEVKETHEALRDGLRKVAEGLAGSERAEFVLSRHVAEAYGALCRAGLCRRPLVERPEAEASLGGFLLGASLSLPGFIGTYVSDPVFQKIAAAICFVAGVVMLIQGIYRGSLPRRREEARHTQVLNFIKNNRVFVAVLVLCLVVAVDIWCRWPLAPESSGMGPVEASSP
jgi:hypothetical protein